LNPGLILPLLFSILHFDTVLLRVPVPSFNCQGPTMRHQEPISQVFSVVVNALLLLLALLATPGCMSTQSASPVSESLDSLGISNRGVREANIRTAYRYGLAVEQAADSIIMLTTDQTTKVNAYSWKIYCIPVIRQIFSQSDPVVSAFDALAFSMQCREYFTTGIGKNRFGSQQQIARNAVENIERRLVDANRNYLTTANFDSLMATTSRWASSNPLTNHVFERASFYNEMDTILARQEYSIRSVVGRIADDVDDLSGRLSLLSAQLPREARWQGEYLISDLTLKERLNSIDTTMVALRATLATLDRELRTDGVPVDITVIRQLQSTVDAALQTLSAERAIVMADIDRLRVATFADGEMTANRAVSGWLNQTEAVVDRLLWKIGVFLAVGFAALTLLLLYLRWSSWRHQRENSAR
jgi:hypothetical protein